MKPYCRCMFPSDNDQGNCLFCGCRINYRRNSMERSHV